VDLSEKLGNVFIASNMKAALAKSATLGNGQSVITKGGVWVGKGWLRVSKMAANKGNVLQRKNEILALEKQVQKQQDEIIRMVSDLEACQQELYENEKQRDLAQSNLSSAQKVHAQAEAEMTGWESEKQHVQKQEAQLQDYLEDVNRQILKSQQELEESQQSKQDADAILEVLNVDKQSLLGQRDSTAFHLDGARNQEVQRREAAHSLALNLESYRSSLNAANVSIERMREQSGQLKQREQSVQEAIQEGNTPLTELNDNLKSFVDQRINMERSS